jgi:threonylcarbamoyladenosine tRNA methylthiotransferase MtaB
MSSEPKVVTFGCRLNSYESEVIKNLLVQSDISEEVIVFNTCAVTKEAERQARQAIKKSFRESPNKKIIVTGCAAQINPKMFSDMPEVAKVIGNQEKLIHGSYKGLDFNSEKVLVNDIMSVKETAGHLVSSFEGKARAFIQIQNGCNHRCTFCTIPYGRGNSRSVVLSEIIEQAKQLIESGYKELVFTGVDITDYGLDLPGSPSLAQMIRRFLALVPNLPRLRLSSIDVAEVDEELLELIKYEKRLMPHIHISAQAGDDLILKRMKRRHQRGQVIKLCHEVREYRQDVTFGGDFIAGFPTETEEMFLNTLNLITEAGIQYPHVFVYSEREGTPASRMPQVPVHIRKERASRLRQAGMMELEKFLSKQKGKIYKVIIENKRIARAENFTKTILDQDLEPGQFTEVAITGYEGEFLIGTVKGIESV